MLIKFGYELEFCLNSKLDESQTIAMLMALCKKHDIDVWNIEKEEADNQYEISLSPMDNVLATKQLSLLKKLLVEHVNIYYNEYCAMHVHISLHDGKNLLLDDDILHNVVAGLCHFMLDDVDIFCPNKISKKRLGLTIHSPSTVSWGVDNRTVALRIPSWTLYPESKRIEHRVPWAGADEVAVSQAIIKAINAGIEGGYELPPRIYGNAFDKQYGCVKLF